MRRPIPLLTGLGLGLGIMYVFDPDQGRRRRTLLGDQLRRAVRRTGNRIEANMPADPLVERVRAALWRVTPHARAIDIEARKGTVRLFGPILADEVTPLLGAVACVQGVDKIDNRLDVHEEAGNIPELQGEVWISRR